MYSPQSASGKSIKESIANEIVKSFSKRDFKKGFKDFGTIIEYSNSIYLKDINVINNQNNINNVKTYKSPAMTVFVPDKNHRDKQEISGCGRLNSLNANTSRNKI